MTPISLARLRAGFRDPPRSARPQAWWHWMNGNVTMEGIALDLAWMRRIGLRGVTVFDVAFATPPLIDQPLTYMSPEWQTTFAHAVDLATANGLEVGIAGSPGFSETGGPWVAPSQAMKKYVWSEFRVTGGSPFDGHLPAPPSTTGAFQTLGIKGRITGPYRVAVPEYYRDSVVIAYPLPERGTDQLEAPPAIGCSTDGLDTSLLCDGDLATSLALPVAPPGEAAWIRFDLGEARTIRALTIVLLNDGRNTPRFEHHGPSGRMLEASDDGHIFRPVAEIPKGGFPQHTIAFPPTTARFFRVTFQTLPQQPEPLENIDIAYFEDLLPGLLGGPQANYEIAQLRLHAEPRVHCFEEKAGFALAPDLDAHPTPNAANAPVLAAGDAIDLTERVAADGRLHWIPPPGDWLILRFGYSLLGITNHPAAPEATGLEVDKLDRSHVRAYLDRYLDAHAACLGDRVRPAGLASLTTDSWEAGPQNWTDRMIPQFTARRGYDPKPYLGVLSGLIVASAQASDQFLWDFRKTLAELVADEHYGTIRDVLALRGMSHFGEAHELGRAFIGDGISVRKRMDVPMGAIWTQRPGIDAAQPVYEADLREAASAAHIHGQNLVGAEAFTAAAGAWAWSPARLKPTADTALLAGVNRFAIHSSVHQPFADRAPGLGLGPFGQWFNRHETWAEQAGAWVDYLARCSFLLEQGRHAADILYFYGEDSNLTALFRRRGPDLPAGYGFDYIDADALISELDVEGGQIVTRSGMRYRLLMLDARASCMSLPVLRKIAVLVAGGASVAGPKPERCSSLADDLDLFAATADALWDCEGGHRAVGRGHVYAGCRPADALALIGCTPDFELVAGDPDTRVEFAHRLLPDGHLFFVVNRGGRAATITARLRALGERVEIWRPEAATMHAVEAVARDDHTFVQLALAPWGSAFILVGAAAADSPPAPAVPAERELTQVSGPWDLCFDGLGAPPPMSFDELRPWNESDDARLRYFSGTGTYSRTLDVPAQWLEPGTSLWLDLGRVEALAEILANGVACGVAWTSPYRVEIGAALRPGINRLEIKVVNCWVNRLIGDAQPDSVGRLSFTIGRPYRADATLQASGLLGPVRLLALG